LSMMKRRITCFEGIACRGRTMVNESVAMERTMSWKFSHAPKLL
jgi:hypothetical protein